MRTPRGWILAILAMTVATLFGGCVSRGACGCPDRDCGRGASSPATTAQMVEAQEAQDKYRELLRRANSVTEAKAAEAEIARLEHQLATLEQRAEIERRGSPSPRIIVYGPLGFVFNLTELILDKLFIIDVL